LNYLQHACEPQQALPGEQQPESVVAQALKQTAAAAKIANKMIFLIMGTVFSFVEWDLRRKQLHAT
jgi:hypothetical protein